MGFRCRICYRELEDEDRPQKVGGGHAGLWCWDCVRQKRRGDEAFQCHGACGMPHPTKKAADLCCGEAELAPSSPGYGTFMPTRGPGGSFPRHNPETIENLRKNAKKSFWRRFNDFIYEE